MQGEIAYLLRVCGEDVAVVVGSWKGFEKAKGKRKKGPPWGGSNCFPYLKKDTLILLIPIFDAMFFFLLREKKWINVYTLFYSLFRVQLW